MLCKATAAAAAHLRRVRGRRLYRVGLCWWRCLRGKDRGLLRLGAVLLPSATARPAAEKREGKQATEAPVPIDTNQLMETWLRVREWYGRLVGFRVPPKLKR